MKNSVPTPGRAGKGAIPPTFNPALPAQLVHPPAGVPDSASNYPSGPARALGAFGLHYMRQWQADELEEMR
jgi:hypothetical protein